MIRDDVEDLSQVRTLQCRCETPETFFAAKLHVRSRVVDDVVAVRAAWRRLKRGGAVRVRDAQVGQVVADSGSCVEGEVRMQLKPIRCRRGHSAFSRKQVERHGHDGQISS